MKKQILTRLSRSCAVFALILLGNAIINILNDRGSAGWPVLIMFLWLVLFEAADHLLSMIPFKTCRQSRIFRMIINYLLAFAGWYWLGWITLNFWGILISVVSYLILYNILQRFCEARRRAEADEINRELARHKKWTHSEDEMHF